MSDWSINSEIGWLAHVWNCETILLDINETESDQFFDRMSETFNENAGNFFFWFKTFYPLEDSSFY